MEMVKLQCRSIQVLFANIDRARLLSILSATPKPTIEIHNEYITLCKKYNLLPHSKATTERHLVELVSTGMIGKEKRKKTNYFWRNDESATME